MAVRSRGKEAFLVTDGTAADPFTTLPLGVTLVGVAIGGVVSYFLDSAKIARGIRMGLADPRATARGSLGTSLQARIAKAPYPGGAQIGIIGGSGRVERMFPDTPRGRAKAERTLQYMESLDEVPAGGDRPKRQGKPAHSAGTPTPRGERAPGGREWRKGGRITGLQG